MPVHISSGTAIPLKYAIIRHTTATTIFLVVAGAIVAHCCAVALTHFERLAEQAMADVAAAILKVKTHDADVARLQARHAAFADAIKLSQRASRVDDDEGQIA